MLTRKSGNLVLIAATSAAVLSLAGCSKSSDSAPKAADAGPACNRQCLIDATNAYVAAMAAHDPAKAPLAANVAFVENVTKMKPGEGLWKSIVVGPGAFAITVPDEANQSAGYIAMLTAMGPQQAPQGAKPEVRAEYAKKAAVAQPMIVAIRLKFDDKGKISEAEHLVSGVRPAFEENLKTPRPGLFAEIPAAQRKPHEELIKIGASYYDALDDNNGELMPFAADCERHENGMITASDKPSPGPAIPGTASISKVARDCKNQMSSNSFQYIARIENRRVFAADPQTGLVMGLSHFRHPMDNLPYKVKNMDGTTSERTKKDMSFAPFDLPAAHIFKIGADGMVHEIEAMGFSAPYNSPTGWEP